MSIYRNLASLFMISHRSHGDDGDNKKESKMNIKKGIIGSALIGALAIVGCVSPLKSTDPAVRKQAMEAVSDQQELFFIAMNIEVGIKGKWPELYQETHLRKGEYPEDVRVMAVNKLSDPKYLLRCASWQDDDLYIDPASENSRFKYKGETFYLNGNYEANMSEKVSPGDAVRKAAADKLSKPEMLKTSALYFNGDARKVLFPSRRRWTGSRYSDNGETAFIDAYGQIKPNNPLDVLFSSLIEKEASKEVIAGFVYNAAESGASIVPNAFNKAICKLDGISSEVAVKLFNRLFLGKCDDASARKERQTAEGKCEKVSSVWAWKVYQHINDPCDEIIVAALKNAKHDDIEKILGKIKRQEFFVEQASKYVEAQTLTDWNNGNCRELLCAAAMCPYIAKQDDMGAAVVTVLNKVATFRSKCLSGWGYSWDDKDRKMAKDITDKATAKLTDDVIEKIIEKDRSAWSALWPVFKDQNRASKLAVKYIDETRSLKDDNKIKKSWNKYSDAITDDKSFMRFSVEERAIRRRAFDCIKNDKVKADTLAAIKGQLTKDLEAAAKKQGEYAGFIADVGNGEDLVEWLKNEESQTELQNKETFAKLKGKTVILKGTVKNIGQTMFSGKTYVALRVAKSGMFNHIDIQFNVPDAIRGKVKQWMKDETHIMRGKINETGDLSEDAKCVDGEIVTEEQYNAVMNLKAEMESIKWQIEQIDANKAPPEATAPSKFGNAVKSAAGWIESVVDDINSSGDDLEKAGEMLNGLFN